MMRSIIGFYVVIEGITMFSWVFNYVYVMTRRAARATRPR